MSGDDLPPSMFGLFPKFDHFSRWVDGGAEHFSSWILNDKLNLTVLERRGRHFFKVQGGGGEAKLKPETDTPELGFKDSIAWSLSV